MISPISNATHAQPVAHATTTSTQKPAQSKPQSASTDSVTLSAAAKAMAANLKEATETPAQTIQEAGGGDPQALRLLAKEAAAKSVKK